jgi:hypothetical protein
MSASGEAVALNPVYIRSTWRRHRLDIHSTSARHSLYIRSTSARHFLDIISAAFRAALDISASKTADFREFTMAKSATRRADEWLDDKNITGTIWVGGMGSSRGMVDQGNSDQTRHSRESGNPDFEPRFTTKRR